MTLFAVAGTDVMFDLPQIGQFILVAFATGVTYMNVRQNTRDIQQVNARYDKLEERFLKAIEDLGGNLSILTTELKSVLSAHEVRLDHIEREEER